MPFTYKVSIKPKVSLVTCWKQVFSIILNLSFSSLNYNLLLQLNSVGEAGPSYQTLKQADDKAKYVSLGT